MPHHEPEPAAEINMDELRAKVLTIVAGQQQDYFRAVWGIDLMQLAEALRKIEQGWGPVDPKPWKKLVHQLVDHKKLDENRAYDFLHRATQGRTTQLSLVTLLLTKLEIDGRNKAIAKAAATDMKGELDFAEVVELLVDSDVIDKKMALELLS